MTVTILVVDDTEANRQLLSYLLDVSGYRVVLAGDAASGYAAAKQEQPDLAIIDIEMPGGGLNLARQMRSDPTLTRTPLLAVSSHGPDARNAAHDAGFDAYLTLPVEPETIIELVEGLLIGGDAAALAGFGHGRTDGGPGAGPAF